MATSGFERVIRSSLDFRRDFLGNMDYRFHLVIFLIPIFISSFSSCDGQGIATDIEGLLAFKAAADLRGALNVSWTGVTNPCNVTTPWLGIKCNIRGRVSVVRLDGFQLTGTFAENTLSRLQELRYLVVSNNSFKGSIPDDLSNVTGLLQLWAQDAQFSGPFPKTLTTANRLVKLNLAGNNFSGSIPNLSGLPTLITLNLSRNNFTGNIPSLSPKLSILDLSSNVLTGNIPLNLPSNLTNLSLSDNQLSGKIPASLASKFTNVSFEGNARLCGPPTSTPCLPSPAPAPAPKTAMQPNTSAVDTGSSPAGSPPPAEGKKHSGKKLSAVDIVVIVIADAVVLIVITLVLVCYYSRRYSKYTDEKPAKKASDTSAVDSSKFSITSAVPDTERNKLVFVDEGFEHKFDLEDLLRASAEMLGKGSFGTAYKAVLEGGTIVAVKRLRDVKDMGKKEFDQQMGALGRLRHVNLVPMRAFYYAKEEKLLVYDFITNGSLFSALHGNRGPGRTPLGWTSRLRIAKGVAVGLAFLHQECESQKIPHGNIKSSNVLLGPNFEVCISDFGLVPLMTPTMAAQRMAGYRAPEYSHTKRISQKADVYSFGVLLLELLTGRQPVQSLQGEGIDLPKWVQSVVREEWTGEVFDLELKSFGNHEEEMVSLLQIAMGCVTSNPDHRPKMAQVVQLIQDIRQGESFMDSESLSFDSHLDESDYGLRDAPFNL